MRKSDEKIFIVTGCTGGIGNAVCMLIRNEGGTVIGINKNNKKKSPYVHQQYSFDLSSATETEKYMKIIGEIYGSPHCLVHCSGSIIPSSFSSLNYEEIASVISDNFFSLLNIIKSLHPVMKKNGGGNIIVIGSFGGIIPMPYSAMYSSSKFAVRGFCLSIAAELKDEGISLSLISPGPVDTNMLEKESIDDNAVAAFIQKPMLPEQIAKKVLQLSEKPCLETVMPSSGKFAALLFNLSPTVFFRSFNHLKSTGTKRLSIYRNNLLIKYTS